MPTLLRARTSLVGLFRALTGDTQTFIRQEIQLAKTELSEKASRLGKNAASLAVGGAVAYAGLIVFLIGLGWLIAYAIESAGVQPVLAGFIGLGAIGLLTIAGGGVLVMKGLKTISQESVKPERTVRTLQELRGTQTSETTAAFAQTESSDKPDSEEMQHRVEATENRMGETLDELGRRLSPQHINAEVKARISANPYRSGIIAMAAGILSGVIIRRKSRA